MSTRNTKEGDMILGKTFYLMVFPRLAMRPRYVLYELEQIKIFEIFSFKVYPSRDGPVHMAH